MTQPRKPGFRKLAHTRWTIAPFGSALSSLVGSGFAGSKAKGFPFETLQLEMPGMQAKHCALCHSFSFNFSLLVQCTKPFEMIWFSLTLCACLLHVALQTAGWAHLVACLPIRGHGSQLAAIPFARA